MSLGAGGDPGEHGVEEGRAEKSARKDKRVQ